MDPLSITVSTITLLNAVEAIVTKIKNIRNANNELLAVSDELSDFERLLRQTKSLIKQHGSDLPEDQLFDLSALLGKAEAKFSELEMITQHRVVKLEAGGKIKALKLAWTREASHITAPQNSLKSITQKLSILLSNISL